MSEPTGRKRSFGRSAARRGLATLLFTALAAATTVPAASAEAPADRVLRGAAVYTMDAARSWAEAIAIRDGRIVWVGNDAAADRWIGPETEVIDLHGSMVLPGFQDAHIHPVSSGVEVLQCDLSGLPSREAVLAEVARCAQRQEGEWLVGAGWQLPVFPGAHPRREALDAIVGDRPAFLAAADGHSAWVSSKALALAGIEAATPDPPGGRIERDPTTGAPTGTLRESATGLVKRLIPPPTLEERLAGLAFAQRELLAHGVTAVQEANAGLPELETYAAAADAGSLRLRVTVALETDEAAGPEQVPALVARRERFARPGVQISAAKIFLDGVIEARTAAMLAPYLDKPGDRGELLWEPERYVETAAALARAGFDVHVHAIGDRAVRTALDGFATIADLPTPERPRHQIAHLEVIDPADLSRFRELGAIANFQPLWAYADTYIVDLTWPGLGADRNRWIYPIGSVARSGGPLAFGSDWSVSSLDPLEGIQVAVTREDPDAPGGGPMQPDERLDLPTALAAYTIGAAWANRREADSGSVEVGKAADLVVLDRNLFALAPEDLADAEVTMTLVDGEVVWRRERAPAATAQSSGNGGGPGGM